MAAPVSKRALNAGGTPAAWVEEVSMRTVLRATAVVAAAGLAVPLWAVPAAFAATSTEAASTGAYFYSAGIDKPEASPAEPPNVTGTATDGVAAEHLAVAVRVPGQVDKKSFLAFDLEAVPFDATLTKAVLTVPLAETSQDNQSVAAEPAKVQACAAGPEGFNSEDGKSFASAPTDTCEALAVPGKASSDGKAYVFDVSKIAATWLTEANNGVALLPADTSAPFQVVFLPFAEASLAVEFTEPPVETEVLDVPVDTGVAGPTDADVPADLTTSFDTGSVGAPDADFGVAEAPVVEPLAPEAAIAAPAPEAAPPVLATPVASTGPSEVLTPRAGAWVAGILFAVALAVLSLIMGDPRVATPGAARASRLSEALQQRQAAGPAARPTLRARGV